MSDYRSEFGALSAYLQDTRQALEESGADRALDLLVTGQLAELFGASTDDASYGRRLMRSTRQFSRTVLGTSVYAAAAAQEMASLAVDEPLDLSVDPLVQEDIGPPRSTRR
jgi:hypothetical protein